LVLIKCVAETGEFIVLLRLLLGGCSALVLLAGGSKFLSLLLRGLDAI